MSSSNESKRKTISSSAAASSNTTAGGGGGKKSTRRNTRKTGAPSDRDDDSSDYQNSPTSSDYGGPRKISTRANGGDTSQLAGGPILVVDDCNVTRAAIKYLLSNLGLSCVMATSGQEAMDMYARGNKFTLVLMDYDMPEMNGVGCTSRIRKIDFDVPIVVLTAYDPSEKERDFLIAGANCVVAKPMTSVTLIGILRTYGLLSW
jgi:CheY-like chemotaxis protein